MGCVFVGEEEAKGGGRGGGKGVEVHGVERWCGGGLMGDGRSPSMNHHTRAPNSGSRTPGSQTPGVPATPSPP